MARPTQAARVYGELKRWYPGECPLPALLDLNPRIALLNTRIFELRHNYGCEIVNRIERTPEGNKSWYRLASISHEAERALSHADVPAISQQQLKPASNSDVTPKAECKDRVRSTLFDLAPNALNL
jgi:hypothetical protein